MKILDLAVLTHDLRRHGLRRGDIGTVVEKYADGALEVEFVMPSGETRGLVTLEEADVRNIRNDDVLAVRTSRAARSAVRRKAPPRTGRASKTGTRAGSRA